jgi:hypothetical protein
MPVQAMILPIVSKIKLIDVPKFAYIYDWDTWPSQKKSNFDGSF